VGAHLARGDDWTQVGPEIPMKDLIRLDLKAASVDQHGLSGTVLATDGPYGNLVTNVDADQFLQLGYQHGDQVPVAVGNQRLAIPFQKTFGEVPLKAPLLYIDSRGHLALAVNQGNFAAKYGIKPPVSLSIARKSK
jgi:S-adenosylmethionine hydrolase